MPRPLFNHDKRSRELISCCRGDGWRSEATRALHTAIGSANRKGHYKGQSPAGARWRAAGSADTPGPICCGHEQRTPQPAGSQGPAVTLSRGRLRLPPSPSSHRYLWPEARSRPAPTQGLPHRHSPPTTPPQVGFLGLGWPCSWPSCPATTCVQAVEAASPHVGDPPSSFAQPPHGDQTASKGSGLRRPQVTSRGGEARFSSCLGTCLCSCRVHSRCPPCRPQRAQQIPPQSSYQLCGKDTLGCPPGTL